MLRTNQSFLAYAQTLYAKQDQNETISLKHYTKGQKLLRQNEVATKVMLIADGITKCFFTEPNDKEYILEFLGKGEIIGEIECIRNIPCLCSIEAMTDVSIYAFSIPLFQSLLKKDLGLNALLIDAFAQRIINTASRASYQQLYTVEHSLAKLLALQAKQEISLSKEDMASYLGITLRSLNRGLKNLQA
ncbi:Crp/Fnr family transcriptional regulator [Cesiribacter sp. SM1]|uniref:Crp/Fnr family transcriptional regulator n=1 Tax=Cesiribacter sp. SM1 TaxID=2861196 RepID=UPI001CD2B047|nr:Crp/Fnr family transcriptional regulator [Cesiribacter sp. SM1]